MERARDGLGTRRRRVGGSRRQSWRAQPRARRSRYSQNRKCSRRTVALLGPNEPSSSGDKWESKLYDHLTKEERVDGSSHFRFVGGLKSERMVSFSLGRDEQARLFSLTRFARYARPQLTDASSLRRRASEGSTLSELGARDCRTWRSSPWSAGGWSPDRVSVSLISLCRDFFETSRAPSLILAISLSLPVTRRHPRQPQAH